MLTISKPLSAGQAQSYHAEEFGNARENYYTETDQIRGEWHGRLAEEWGLRGEVREEHFQRLSEGQHPITGEQLIRRQAAREYMNRRGEKVSAMEHRAGWDATFSAPKSVSLTALVGRDDHVREAHRESVGVALDELERYVQARIGGNLPAETTGKWVAAKFEHDSARPVDGYAAPQLHTHVVFFNLAETDDGEAHALQPRELYKTQQYATAVYRSELAYRLKELGYEIERGESSQPEVKGYSKEYLEASSPRRQQIEEHLAKENQRGAAAAQIAAHQTREGKLELSHEEMQQRHKEMAAQFGDQPERIVEAAGKQREQLLEEPGEKAIGQAVAYSREKNLERDAVAEERDLLRDALKRSMGDAAVAEVKAEFEKRVQAGEFIETSNRPPGRAFTTEEMIHYERDTIHAMHAGQNQHAQIASFETRRKIEQDHSHLSEGQRAAVDQILSSRDQVTALEGVAGAGKTTSLGAIREAAERDGYKVEGFAPTSRAAQKLGEAGIESSTLQRHLARSQEPYDGQQRLYVLDESSLASTKQMNEFLHRLKENDRVLLVGDTRQHEAVEAGRPYHQLQEAGIATARLDEIVRQKDPALRDVVEKLSRGQVKEAMEKLDAQGRVHEIFDRDERMATIAHENEKENLVTLKRENGEHVRYDPRGLHGVTLYRETERGFSQGDRVQFTAPNRERHIANRELGTIEKIDDSGNLQLRLDSGREVAFNIKENLHLDYGYAVTSHGSQGQTADRVLIHVDTEQAGEKLVNRRLAYVAVSRGRYDAQLYTNDKTHLTEQLSRDVSHRSAIEPSRESAPQHRRIEPLSARSEVHERTQAEGHSISR